MAASRSASGGANSPTRLSLRFAIVLALTLLYFLAGKLGLSLAFVNPSATAVWPPTGIALAAFLLLGGSVWPGILLGAFLVNLSTSHSLAASSLIAVGNTLEGWIGAYVVQRFARGEHAFERAQDTFKYTLLVALASTPVSATIGSAALLFNGLARAPDLGAIWLTWWLGDVGGDLIVAPLLLLWAQPPFLPRKRDRWLESGALVLSSLVLALWIFSRWSPWAAAQYPLEFAVMPLVLWAGLRFGQRATASVTAVLSGIAIAGTLQGAGPFAHLQPGEALLLLQAYMDMVAVLGLGLAALVSERAEAETALRGSNEQLKRSLEVLEEHDRKIHLLHQMNGLLQSCADVEEAYAIIGHLGRDLFRQQAGALYLINDGRHTVEAAAKWGELPPQADAFGLEDCWALRRGRIHFLKKDGLELLCPHLSPSPPRAAICIPMQAQSQVIGVLHIRSNAADGAAGSDLDEALERLAQTMADSTALALANLRLRMSLRQQSIRDPLTALFNRRYLEETLERELYRAARLVQPVGILLFDLDRFKTFNDRFGHEAGDTLLRGIGRLLAGQIRNSDIACRYGGEEFAVIVPEMPLGSVRERAELLCRDIKALQLDYRGEILPAVSISVGVAMFPLHGGEGTALLQAADAALYEAKRQGRDRVVVAPAESAGAARM